MITVLMLICWVHNLALALDCKNKKSANICQAYAASSRGYCKIARRWMMKNCEKSCDFCVETCDKTEVIDGTVLPASNTVTVDEVYKVTCTERFVISGVRI